MNYSMIQRATMDNMIQPNSLNENIASGRIVNFDGISAPFDEASTVPAPTGEVGGLGTVTPPTSPVRDPLAGTPRILTVPRRVMLERSFWLQRKLPL
jgi:hypothetical protein